MPFAFERDDANVEQGVRRIAIEQIDKALLSASGPQADFGETVHQLRRRCKSLRGLLRMVREGMDDFRVEDRAIQGAASRLSQVRDAAVVVQTFDKLMDSLPEAQVLGDQERQQLRDLLTERSHGAMLHVDQGAAIAGFCEVLVDVRGRAAKWTLRHKGFGAIGDGIEDTYRRMRQQMREAEVDGSPVVLHAWRKQAKYHRNHLMLLRHHAPDVLAGRSKLLAELADLLGVHHDLEVLVEVLSGRIAGASASLDSIAAVAAERQATLAEQAFTLGGQMAADKPRDLTRQLKRYWTLEAA